MKKLTFQQKLWIPLICSLLCITIIFVYNALEIRKIRIEERSADLANAADLGLGAVKMFGDLAASGALSTPEAQKQALQPRHLVPHPKAPAISARAVLDGVADALLFAHTASRCSGDLSQTASPTLH